MKTLLLPLLLGTLLVSTNAQDRRVRVISPSSSSQDAAGLEDLRNYRLELTLDRREQPGARYLMTTSSGELALDLIDPASTKIDGHEIPRTISVQLNLRPREGDEGEVVASLFIGRSLPYVSGTTQSQARQGADVTSRPIIQERSLGLKTRIVLAPGKAVTLLDDGREVITLKLLE